MEFFSGFTWAVPHAFSDAVALCRFEEGDMLYDTPKAYEGDWGDAIKYITHSLQVRYPARVTTSEKSGGIFEKNWNSEVRIELYKKQEKVGVGQIRTTQGRLYTALWKGDLTVLELDSEESPIPLNARQVTKQLNEVRTKALEFAIGFPVFVMVCDHSNQISREKYLKVHAELKKHLSGEPPLIEPKHAELKDWKVIAPTIEIAFFSVNGINYEQLESLVKEAVYVPVINAKKELFKMGAHGAIFE